MKLNAWEKLFFLALCILLVLDLASFPNPSFDEGWALSIARNWIQIGHYGQMLNGQPISASMLNIGFPAIMPMAFAFRIFGIGFWQGRFPIVVFSLGSFVLIYWLARRLYDIRAAIAVIAYLILFVPAVPWVHPLLVGRQAIGEMPAMFYLLAGYVFFFLAVEKSRWFTLGCVLLWGLATITKLQGLPFLLAGLCFALILSLIKKKHKSALLLALVTVGFILSFALLRRVQNILLNDQMLHQMNRGLFQTTAFVLTLPARRSAIIALIVAGLPTMSALLWKGRKWRMILRGDDDDMNTDVVKIVMWIQVAAWLSWYLILSVGWPRYIFSPIFLGSIIVAASAAELTSGFKRSAISLAFHTRLGIVPGVFLSLAIFFHGISIVYSLIALKNIPTSQPAQEVAHFLNQKAGFDPLVETYEMELFVLLNLRYHYPSDEVQLQLNRRTFLGQNVNIDYNPLKTKPDFLVVGPQARLWHLYDDVAKSGCFALKKRAGPYEIYERSRM